MKKIAVIGLGYVGLPLAAAFGEGVFVFLVELVRFPGKNWLRRLVCLLPMILKAFAIARFTL